MLLCIMPVRMQLFGRGHEWQPDIACAPLVELSNLLRDLSFISHSGLTTLEVCSQVGSIFRCVCWPPVIKSTALMFAQDNKMKDE